MARSPVASESPRKLITSTLRRVIAARQKRSRSSWESVRSVAKVHHNLFQQSRLFRMGVRYALEIRKTFVRIKYVDRERVVGDPTLKVQVERLDRQNQMIIKENTKLKQDKNALQTHLQKAYHTEVDLYLTKLELEELGKNYQQLVQCVEKLKASQRDGLDFAETSDGEEFLERTASVKGGNYPRSLSLGAPHHPKSLPASQRPDFTPIREEIDHQMLKPVRAASLLGGNGKQTGARGKRHTALPRDLQRALVSVDQTTPTKPPLDNSQVTPTRPIRTAESPDLANPAHPRGTPEEPLAIPVTPGRPSKRSHSAAVEGKTSKELLGARSPLGISPRPVGFARRSLQIKLSPKDEEAGSSTTPKRRCALDNGDSEEEELWETMPGRSFLSVVREDECDLDREAKSELKGTYSVLEDKEISETAGRLDELSLSDGGSRRRSSRVAKDKIVSMKEPNLNTKMRRPVNVAPLTPNQDRRHKPKKSAKSKNDTL